MPAAATSAPAASESSCQIRPAAELVRQVDAYVALGYPDVAGMTEDAFRALFESLAKPVADAVA